MKAYIKPMIEVVHICPQQMMAFSFSSDNSKGSGSLNNDYAEGEAMSRSSSSSWDD